ncbi:SDR family oxidoreductase [Arenibacterium halophilum]|uniref:SDR family oxidoreductase n=1 Tax=Arenibacterium halophilum TaxID=2583821 RepID=A0ABY2XFH9_9RHOB|nr:SDR family oxidoreductase [Arenibacterium halophilum]TMV15347.1 SDR family oxidoreductase [Arenibacterium halophilum]
MTIAITGATGQLGRLVVEKLRERAPDTPVVALARSPEKADDLGTEVRPFDYDKVETLAPALAGVETLLLISASEVGRRVPQHQAVIDAAKAAGVKRIVYTSLLRADTAQVGLAQEHRDTEAALAASGLAVTLLRNGWYTENYLASLPAALEHNALLGSAGDGRISSATREDYAEAAAVAMLDESHAGRTYELAGDTSYTLTDLAAAISAKAGRTIPYVDMPVPEYAAVLEKAGFPAPVAQMLADFDTAAKRCEFFDDSHTLSTLIGRPTTPLDSAVAAAL